MAARFCFLVLALLPWCLSAHRGAYDYGFDVSRQLNKRQFGEPIVVKGWGSDNVQVRQEIRELERDRELWTLYLLGVSLMQFSDQSSLTSWYSLTGMPCPRPASTLHGERLTPPQGYTEYLTRHGRTSGRLRATKDLGIARTAPFSFRHGTVPILSFTRYGKPFAPHPPQWLGLTAANQP